MARPTVEDLVRHARIPDIDRAINEGDLLRYLGAAIADVEAKCGPMEATSTTRARLRGGVLTLPFVGVDAVTVTGPTGDAVLVDEDATDYAAGLVHVRARVPGRYTLTVTRDQRAVDALWLATLLIAAHLWDSRRGATATNRPVDVDEASPLGYGIPRKASDLLGPWMTPVLA